MKLVKSALTLGTAAVMFAMLPANISAKVVKYGVIGWQTNAAYGCGKGFANIVTAQPIRITSRFDYWDRSDQYTAEMRVLSYWYDNNRTELDRVAKTTKVGWGNAVWADTPQEAMSMAQQSEMFATSQFSCEGSLYRIDMSGFDKLQATTGAYGSIGEERWNLLNEYFNKD